MIDVTKIDDDTRYLDFEPKKKFGGDSGWLVALLLAPYIVAFVAELLRASAVGWYSAVVGLLGLVASVVAGLLWDRVSHAAVFSYGAMFALAGSVGLLFVSGKRDPPTVDAYAWGATWVNRKWKY